MSNNSDSPEFNNADTYTRLPFYHGSTKDLNVISYQFNLILNNADISTRLLSANDPPRNRELALVAPLRQCPLVMESKGWSLLFHELDCRGANLISNNTCRGMITLRSNSCII